jgi:glutathione S-transferase
MFYTLATIYPLIGRATYPALGFPPYPGEVAASEADDATKAKGQADAVAALEKPLEAFRAFFLDGKTFVGGDDVTIADIRFAVSIEFLRVIDYPYPAWATEYLAAVEAALGEAYSEPAADVRGYIEYVRSQAA